VKKRLSTLGNSLALVIDKPLRDLLGIDRATVLSISTDGRRLIIDPIASTAVLGPPASQLDAVSAAQALAGLDISRANFRRLHHQGMSFAAYQGWLACGYADEADTAELATIQRIEACLRGRVGGGSWDEAVEAAIAAFPLNLGASYRD
jgi:hypothetical protein